MLYYVKLLIGENNEKLKYCGLIAITAFGLASCGVSKDNLVKECT